LRDEYARSYADLYRRHWWWRAREEYLLEVLRRHLPRHGSSGILDVGCGAGLFFERLAEFGPVHGIETDATMRTGRPDIDDRIHWGTFESFRPAGSFDAILMLDVLEHLTDPLTPLRLSLDLVEPRGVLVATVPAFPLLWTSHDVLNEHVRRYTRRTFRRLLERGGWRADVLDYFFHWTFPAKLMVRLAEALPGQRGRQPSPPRVPASRLNHVLYRLSRFEQVHLRRLRIPFGSSLLAVARPA
jgi:SAM-dependent methyltransferase